MSFRATHPGGRGGPAAAASSSAETLEEKMHSHNYFHILLRHLYHQRLSFSSPSSSFSLQLSLFSLSTFTQTTNQTFPFRFSGAGTWSERVRAAITGTPRPKTCSDGGRQSSLNP
ncbi:hypothetical protein E2C01_073300 [Portunus trituberculatus]|uniref:Uncharacterized protein n=1 Tax=Portunus trituberculatus TaxID=210409 RepID=A0A5B7I4Z4_PORTR|nr:hypothetical protein [Portunus trituberculatus]